MGDMVWPVLAARVPAFEAAKVVNSWAGYYDKHLRPERHRRRHPEIESLIFRHRLLGHGISSRPPSAAPSPN